LDRSILINIEEKFISMEHTKTSELIGARMDITNSTLDKTKSDEEDMDVVLKELEHLCHLAKYYQDSTQATVFLRREFQEAYSKFMNEQHIFTARIVELQ